jgi:type III secretory pathway component EscU
MMEHDIQFSPIQNIKKILCIKYIKKFMKTILIWKKINFFLFNVIVNFWME